MKRLRQVFPLTVPEQRLVLALLLAWVLYLFFVSGRNEPRPTLQPSPSPGMRP